jgi:hypothetical protein
MALQSILAGFVVDQVANFIPADQIATEGAKLLAGVEKPLFDKIEQFVDAFDKQIEASASKLDDAGKKLLAAQLKTFGQELVKIGEKLS